MPTYPPSFATPHLEPDHLSGGMPTFNAAAAPTMPAPMMPPPSVAQAPPAFRPPMPPQGQGMGGELARLIPALLLGLKDPSAMGAALRGLQKGKDRRLAMQESAQQQQDRRAREAAEFQSRMLETVAQFDDEIALQDYLRMITPTAEYYGVPVAGMSISDQKKATRDRKQVQDAIDRAVKMHGPEVLNRDDVSVQLADGRTFSMATARQMIGDVTAADGKPLPVTPAAAADSFTLSEGQTRFGPDGKPLASVPKSAAAQEAATFTLSPGQVRYAEDGSILARGPAQREPQGPQGSPQWVVGPDGQQAYRIPQAGDVRHDPIAERQGGDETQTRALEAMRLFGDDMLSVIDSLIDPSGQLKPGAKGVIGGLDGMRPEWAYATEGSQIALADIDRLQSMLNIDTLRDMKSQSRTGATGFGALSERELNVVESSASKLRRRRQSEAEYAAELLRIRNAIMVGRAQGAPTDPAAPPPAPARPRIRRITPVAK